MFSVVRGMSKQDRTALLVCMLMISAALWIASVSIFASVKLVGESFPGFLVNQRMVVTSTGQYRWTGSEAGLQYPDKIIAIDGEPVESLDRLYFALNEKGIGENVQYTIQRGEETVRHAVRTMAFSWADFHTTIGMFYLVALAYLALGLVVFVLKFNRHVSWAFFLACFSLSVYYMLAPSVTTPNAFGLTYLYIAANALFPAATLHMSLYFPRPRTFIERRGHLAAIPYLLSACLLVPVLSIYPASGFVFYWKLIVIYMVASAFVLLLSILAEYARPAGVLARQRAKVVLIGALLAFPVPALAYASQILLGSFFSGKVHINYLAIPVLIFPISIAFAIVKHNLFDVDIYVKRAVGYVIMIAVVATAYFLVQAGLTQFVLVPLFGESGEFAYPFVFAILVVLLFQPINTWVISLVEKLFFRKSFDYKETISVVQKALANILDSKEMADRVLQTIRDEMFVDSAGVVILQDGNRTGLPVFAADEAAQTAALNSRVCIETSDPLIKLIDRERKLITEYDLQEGARYRGVREACGRALAKLGATLVFPMIAHDRLVGVLFVGHKKSGKFFNRDDIDLLQSLSTHGAIAIENARLFNIKGTFSRYLAPTVIDELVAHPEKLRLGGERREITALFSDIAGFTATAESLAPEELVQLLNEYFSEACDVVLRHGATIDKIVGDALHLLFNAPVDQPDHAERAVRCGLELSECCRRLATERGLALGDTRIGINTGFAVVGNFGGSARFDYTAHGDAVNTAARLEGANKYLGTLVCVSADTKARCDGIAFRAIGKLILQGKHETVEVYEPLQPGAVSETLLTDYRAAYELMVRRDPGARDAFLALAERFPDDGLIGLHADRLRSGETDETIRLSGK